MDHDLRYPIGPFVVPDMITEEQLVAWTQDIAELPSQLRQAVEGLDEQQLNTPYREGGWTVRQVVHHLADSHMNGYIRFKLALTEDTPTINPYDEGRWAEIPDARELPLEPSLRLLEGLHERWVVVLRSLGGDQYSSYYFSKRTECMVIKGTLKSTVIVVLKVPFFIPARRTWTMRINRMFQSLQT
ncbi:YfiT family bacillithiol transferase [Paenibacillus sp. NRS-1782]|uniref:YfiT family bacillithiol transferase n=1 Tax=unclassified Paenibacillus TaxID=185978 RepID=UPI003D2B5CA4